MRRPALTRKIARALRTVAACAADDWQDADPDWRAELGAAPMQYLLPLVLGGVLAAPIVRDFMKVALADKPAVPFRVPAGIKLIRIDPKSGEVKLVTSPTPNSRPYGLVINSKGIPVFVEFGVNKIATIDPNTLAIKEYTLPNAASRPRRRGRRPRGRRGSCAMTSTSCCRRSRARCRG